MTGSPINTKLPIINSTGLYLARIISENKRTNDGTIHPQELIERIHNQGRESLFLPSSKYTDGNDLWQKQKSTNLSELNAIDEANAILIADAYLEELEQAKKDNRYFGRNLKEIIELFGNRQTAVAELKKFLGTHGYHIRPTDEQSQNDQLFDLEIDKYLIHESELSTTGEMPVSKA